MRQEQRRTDQHVSHNPRDLTRSVELLLIKRVLVLDYPPRYSDPADNYKGVPMTPSHVLIFLHSSWQELHQVILLRLFLPFLSYSVDFQQRLQQRQRLVAPILSPKVVMFSFIVYVHMFKSFSFVSQREGDKACTFSIQPLC